jgi:hypothetical protein
MHRSSETVAAIATALAKAQIDLSNPEKTAVGLISNISRGEGERTFRYAPLSTGLELVRKSLGGQQIAVLQTTEIDRPSGMVNLTTILMHTSGEWISSDWPVCQLSDASTPRRMGAALTYARRYSLFALVGIAGEDDNDLDAQPDDRPSGQPILEAGSISSPIALAHPRRSNANTPKLAPDQSAERRDQLVDQIQGWVSLETLQAKSIDLLKAKNCLQSADAKAIETAFQLKMAALEATAIANDAAPSNATKAESQLVKVSRSCVEAPRRKPRGTAEPVAHNDPESARTTRMAARKTPNGKSVFHIAIDKSLLTIGEPRRHRDKAHLRFVASQPCLICGRSPSDPHHLRFAQPRALGRKSSDEFVVPLCRTHHRQNHQVGDERSWWQPTAIDPLRIARELWTSSRGIVDKKP